MFEQTFKNIDDILHKDAGCGSELDYIEQTSWVLFLKYLDDLEQDRYQVILANPPFGGKERAEVQQKLENLEELKKSILQKAFRGEL
ncbi:MAG: type I restriction-modification system subunit M N-terminal domain-containing protein [Spirochaetota bacterium]|nr:type I restriction-modification system subunit M N-terminal domain-containing protein [Spirochaetota bacterium]